MVQKAIVVQMVCQDLKVIEASMDYREYQVNLV